MPTPVEGDPIEDGTEISQGNNLMCPSSDQLNTMLKHDNESSYKGMIAV